MECRDCVISCISFDSNFHSMMNPKKKFWVLDSTFRFTLSKCSRLKKPIYYSPDNVNFWRIRIGPDDENFLRCGIHLNTYIKFEDFTFGGNFEVRILKADTGEVGIRVPTSLNTGSKTTLEYSIQVVEWDMLLNPDTGYINNDEITFEIRVTTSPNFLDYSSYTKDLMKMFRLDVKLLENKVKSYEEILGDMKIKSDEAEQNRKKEKLEQMKEIQSLNEQLSDKCESNKQLANLLEEEKQLIVHLKYELLKSRKAEENHRADYNELKIKFEELQFEKDVALRIVQKSEKTILLMRGELREMKIQNAKTEVNSVQRANISLRNQMPILQKQYEENYEDKEKQIVRPMRKIHLTSLNEEPNLAIKLRMEIMDELNKAEDRLNMKRKFEETSNEQLTKLQKLSINAFENIQYLIEELRKLEKIRIAAKNQIDQTLDIFSCPKELSTSNSENLIVELTTLSAILDVKNDKRIQQTSASRNGISYLVDFLQQRLEKGEEEYLTQEKAMKELNEELRELTTKIETRRTFSEHQKEINRMLKTEIKTLRTQLMKTEQELDQKISEKLHLQKQSEVLIEHVTSLSSKIILMKTDEPVKTIRENDTNDKNLMDQWRSKSSSQRNSASDNLERKCLSAPKTIAVPSFLKDSALEAIRIGFENVLAVAMGSNIRFQE